jgi:hypothetical protein
MGIKFTFVSHLEKVSLSEVKLYKGRKGNENAQGKDGNEWKRSIFYTHEERCSLNGCEYENKTAPLKKRKKRKWQKRATKDMIFLSQ